MWARNITLERFRETLRELLGVELGYALRRLPAGAGEDEFALTLNRLTELYFYSRFRKENAPADKNPEWMRALGGLYEMFAAGDEADVIFGRAWTLFFDDDSALLKLIEKGKAEIERSFNGFSWEAHYEYYKDEKSPPLLTLHSRNYFSQDSPFDHTDELAEGLLRILDEAEKKRPDLKDVQCASWLNNLPPFQALFPAGWREKAVACPVEGHTGCWGQLIDRTGEINRKNLARLNTCGELQYMNLHCKCAVSALRRHLTAELREAQRV